MTDRHVTRLSQSEHAISSEVVVAYNKLAYHQISHLCIANKEELIIGKIKRG